MSAPVSSHPRSRRLAPVIPRGRARTPSHQPIDRYPRMHRSSVPPRSGFAGNAAAWLNGAYCRRRRCRAPAFDAIVGQRKQTESARTPTRAQGGAGSRNTDSRGSVLGALESRDCRTHAVTSQSRRGSCAAESPGDWVIRTHYRSAAMVTSSGLRQSLSAPNIATQLEVPPPRPFGK